MPATRLTVFRDGPVASAFLNANTTINITINASYFEQTGWQAPKPVYRGTFDPKTGWLCKRRGEVMVLFEDETKRKKASLEVMADHGLIIHNPSSDITGPASPGQNKPVVS